MTIQLIISKNEALKIRLMDKSACVDEVLWKDKADISHNLLQKIDILLKKNAIGIDKISGYKIISNIPSEWTTYRIAKIALETIMVAKNAGLAKKNNP